MFSVLSTVRERFKSLIYCSQQSWVLMWHQEAGKIRVYNSTSSFKEMYWCVFLLLSLCSFAEATPPWETPSVHYAVLERKQSHSQSMADVQRGTSSFSRRERSHCGPDLLGTLLPSCMSSPLISTLLSLMVCSNSATLEILWEAWGFHLVFKNSGNIHTWTWKQTSMCWLIHAHMHAHASMHTIPRSIYKIEKPISS